MGIDAQQEQADGRRVGSACRVMSAAPDRRRVLLPGLVRVERIEIVAGEVMEQVRNPGGIGELTGVHRVEHVRVISA